MRVFINYFIISHNTIEDNSPKRLLGRHFLRSKKTCPVLSGKKTELGDPYHVAVVDARIRVENKTTHTEAKAQPTGHVAVALSRGPRFYIGIKEIKLFNYCNALYFSLLRDLIILHPKKPKTEITKTARHRPQCVFTAYK